MSFDTTLSGFGASLADASRHANDVQWMLIHIVIADLSAKDGCR